MDDDEVIFSKPPELVLAEMGIGAVYGSAVGALWLTVRLLSVLPTALAIFLIWRWT